ncbi:M48 family metallopeptidase [Hankyongella ginsenosidimutans]|uniref:M48 family metallopeptidase n=1 Tax=Hankyongella ginsenosidimutans TaxID=1763828 RepID=A0A4D7CBT6_9SPHN|nr:M48 family metallopeptidase [Hankyongella ginsenosidimutans]QCI80176.1 M48 family metallopeptidase [Hankyongella ginsenosidimutans]
MAFDPAAATAAYIASIPPDVQARSIAYTEGGYWLLPLGLIVTGVVTWIIVRWGILAKLRDRAQKSKPRPSSAAFQVAATYIGLSALITLPWTIYTDWWRPHHYGLSKQPLGDWLGQGMIGLVLNVLIGGLFFMGLYWLIRRLPRLWWLAGAGMAGAGILLMLLIAPVFIEPLFNKYEPFPKGPARDAIVALAKDAGVPEDRIFVFNGSRQRDVVTANVSGAFGSARIAVSDIAVDRASLPEVRAVVGHEIGHYKLGHSLRSVLFFSAMALLAFWATHRLFQPALRWFGAQDQVQGLADPAGLPVLLFVVSVFGFLATPLLNSYIRIGEVEADQYSLDHARDPDGLSTALLKAVEYRKASPGRLEEIIFHDHPGVENRVRMAMEWKARHQK